MWNYNEESVKKATATGGNYVEESGIYNCKIEDAQIIKSEKTKAEALMLILKEDKEGKSIRLRFWYKKGDGTENSYAVETLNKLTYLCKIKHENVIAVPEGEEVKVPCYIGKTIGVINEVKLNTNGEKTFLESEAKGFFDLNTKKTADEIMNSKPAAIVERWKQNFEKNKNKPKNDVPYETDKTIKQATSLDDDEFPF